MDPALLRSYLATVYELPTETGVLSVSIDGELGRDETTLPPLLRESFAILTAYNPRSMLLPRRVRGRGARPELIASDPTCDPIGKTYQAYWRVRS